MVLSPDILVEYQHVGSELATQYPDLAAVWEPVLALIAMNATVVDAPPLAESVSGDPADEMFLAAAIASDTRIIVSGDKDLLRVSGWRGILICTPRRFHDEHLATVDS
ncbi:MAG: putative toxin-antitoxin system toxin component, PIN family [Gemmatimonadaceae bacterium]